MIKYKGGFNVNKVEAMTAKYEECLNSVGKNAARWTDFLKTAAANYKYSFMDQIMIYAQRPEAKACASFVTWTDRLKRGIKKGTKGIALLRQSKDDYRLEYVYDIADTYKRTDSANITLWRLEKEYEEAVVKTLGGENDIRSAVASAVHTLIRNTELEGEILSLMERTAVYITLCRMNIDVEIDSAEFDEITKVDTETLSSLGETASNIARKVLRETEKTIKEEREKIYGNDLQRNGRNASSGLGRNGTANGESRGTLRGSSPQAHDEEQPEAVRKSLQNRETSDASEGDRPKSRGGDREDNISFGTAGQDGRGAEADRPHEVDRTDEQLQAHSRRTGSSKHSLSINENQISMNELSWEESGGAKTAAFSMPQNIVDIVLRDGTNEKNSVLEICIELSKNKSLSQKAEFLKKLYAEDGKGFEIDGVKVSTWWNDDGIKLSFGSSTDSGKIQLLSWEEAATRIDELLDLGRYASMETLNQMQSYEYKRAAESIWYLKRDLDYEAYPELKELFKGEVFQTFDGFPNDTKRIAQYLKTKEGLDETFGAMQRLCGRYDENHDIVRFRYQNPYKVKECIEDLYLPRKAFTASESVYIPPTRFITEDEITALLKRSNISRGEIDTYMFFRDNPGKKERTDFLKKLYGYSGLYNGRSNTSYDAKGIEYSHGDLSMPYARALISWEEAAKRIGRLIESHSFLTEDEVRALSPASPTEDEPKKIILFPVGDFYEIFGDEAVEAAKILNIKIMGKNVNGEKIPMTGFPKHALKEYEQILNKNGYDVGFVESEETSLERAKHLISEFCKNEYDSEADFNDISKIGIAHTTTEDDLHTIQVNANLVDFSISRYIDEMKVDERTYASLSELIENELMDMDFDELVYFPDEQLAPFYKKPKQNPTYEQLNYNFIKDFAPYVLDGKVRYTLFESKGFMPVHVSKLSENTIRIAHTYEQNGDLMYDPEMVFEIDAENKALKPLEYRQDNMGIYQIVGENVTDRELSSFAVQWFRNIRNQRFYKAREVIDYNNEDISVSYNEKGNVVDVKGEENAVAMYIEENNIKLPTDEAVTLLGKELMIDNHKFIVDSISDIGEDVTLRDITFENSTGFPINRIENIDTVKHILASQAQAPERGPEEQEGFEYNGYHFVPIGKIGSERTLQEITNKTVSDNSLGMSVYKESRLPYSYDKFYLAAHQSEADVFRCIENGKTYLPGTNELFEYTGEFTSLTRKKQTETQHTESERDPDNSYDDAFFVNNENESVRWLYYNPNSTSGGQYVINNVSFSDIRTAYLHSGSDCEEFFDYLGMIAYQELADLGTEWFDAAEAEFYSPVTLTDCTDETMNHLLDFAKSAEKETETFSASSSFSPKARYKENIAAINLLRKLEAENRSISPEEREILLRYVGWGGLSEAFNENKANWAKEYKELKELLSPKEYEQARSSTLTAFYTPPVVINSIYSALDNMGFKTGKILEPSCGTGNFLGMLPEKMAESEMYGVELDSLSGRIAQKLYPNSNISIQGFEESSFEDNFFDVAVGNVPFGDFKVFDKRYNKYNFSIHDYFFAKAIDKVRPGGVIAFITSSYTMDAKTSGVRKYIAERANLLGALRLPNDTFKANAGTEVTSDILFLQKRETLRETESDWVNLSVLENGIAVNRYFADNPHMILGEMTTVSSRFGFSNVCKAYENRSLEDLLSEAVKNISGKIPEYTLPETKKERIAADKQMRNFSFVNVDDEIFFCENGALTSPSLSKSAIPRVKGMIEIRDCVRELIDEQLKGADDETIRQLQSELNEVYDRFSQKYGHINDKENKRAFSKDDGYFLIASLENYDGKGNFIGKSKIFTQRTVRPKIVVTHVDTATEALILSVSEKAKVDMEYMSFLTGKTEDELFSELKGEIFLNPSYSAVMGNDKYLTADEYLSGNVRTKLNFIKEAMEKAPELFPTESYGQNISALESVLPTPITADEIGIRLGATWVPQDIVTTFCREIAQVPYWHRSKVNAMYNTATSGWHVDGKLLVSGTAANLYGTAEKNVLDIVEDTLNLREVKVYKTIYANGTEKRVLNMEATIIAQQKQNDIRREFVRWVWDDPSRRNLLETLYNEKFNSIVPRTYDGSHISFYGMNPEVKLREHQKNAVARIMYGGNTLIAHVVGAGKTWTMAAAAIEMKKLGLCSKSLFVVPNHLTDQWAKEFVALYPSANILAVTDTDFKKENRKSFCGRIAANDYDAVIIGHSQFSKIPMSFDYQVRHLNKQIDDLSVAIMSSNDRSWTTKQFELAKKRLTERLQRLLETGNKDSVVTFEELGVDRIFIDESDEFKNLYLYSKMSNVSGISQSESQKAADLFMKTQYLNDITHGKGVIFATGTPISNSMAEMYTVQRYLQYDLLSEMGHINFDDWASAFGETVTAMEITPEGTGQRFKTRFSKFCNLPELMNIFCNTADIQTAEMLNLPVPESEIKVEITKPSDIQKQALKLLAIRADKIRKGNPMDIQRPGGEKFEDNMLLVTNDGRKLALDQRLIVPEAEEDADNKIQCCAERVHEYYINGAEQKLTQLVFCDLSTPGSSFNIYDALKGHLIEKGIPEDEIAYIHNAKTKAEKEELFGKVRSGDIRVLLGSTAKMGAGTNVQERLIAIHDLDCPWRPRDLEQRAGRIIRQGNLNPKVFIHRYITEGTFDAYLYQIIENKQRFISQIMSGKAPARTAEDIDEAVLSYGEIKALATGNPLIKEKAELEAKVHRLSLIQRKFYSQQSDLKRQLKLELPNKISEYQNRIKDIEADIVRRDENTHEEWTIDLGGITYHDKAQAGKALLDMRSKLDTTIGKYRGFSMKLEMCTLESGIIYNVKLMGKQTYKAELGGSDAGNITRIDNCLNRLEEIQSRFKHNLEQTQKDIQTAEENCNKPWEQQQELTDAENRLSEINIRLSTGNLNDSKLFDEICRRFASVINGEKPFINNGYLMFENMGGGVYSLALYEKAEGKFMREPCFTFKLNKEEKSVEIMEYFKDSEDVSYSLLQGDILPHGNLDIDNLPSMLLETVLEIEPPCEEESEEMEI